MTQPLTAEETEKLARLMYDFLEGVGGWQQASDRERTDFRRTAKWIASRWDK